MRLDTRVLLISIVSALMVPVAVADTALLTLQNNPFSKPEILEIRIPVTATRQLAQLEPIEIELTATMVSATYPMVIVDGELLAIGDSVKGLKLVRVMEGEAEFSGPNGPVIYRIAEDVQ